MAAETESQNESSAPDPIFLPPPLLLPSGYGDGPDRRDREIALVRRHYERKGYRAVSGLQFGGDLVLYADDPSVVHSDFCVVVVPGGAGGRVDWRNIQTLVRSMSDLRKTLILVYVRSKPASEGDRNQGLGDAGAVETTGVNAGADTDTVGRAASVAADDNCEVCEIAVMSEHAPFRRKKSSAPAGSQMKKRTRYQR
eukprot:CAMPEP_0194298710 /NCGR_PEP_ID=MMETSP0169-20130528/60317_1 /TAXON_ID=218684 /ORGANISM="Corethron pennatum, Strain L29A3" /LENGTH=196 /DNA_ID=CAMNT_0039048727 /DNA_START=54 /DNA_END=644 /DNA_ORIENTATION=+